jgi:hypothetical protein
VFFCSNYWHDLLFYFYNPECSGQLIRTTTNSRIYWTFCKPNKQIKHHRNDRRTNWDLNPRYRDKKPCQDCWPEAPRCYWHDLWYGDRVRKLYVFNHHYLSGFDPFFPPQLEIKLTMNCTMSIFLFDHLFSLPFS